MNTIFINTSNVVYDTYNVNDDKYLIHDVIVSGSEIQFTITNPNRHIFLAMKPNVFYNISEIYIDNIDLDIIYDRIMLNISKHHVEKYLHGIIISKKYLQTSNVIHIVFNNLINDDVIKIYQFDKIFTSLYKLSVSDHNIQSYFKYEIYRNYEDDIMIYNVIDTISSYQHDIYIYDDQIIRYECECSNDIYNNSINTNNDSKNYSIENKIDYLRQDIIYSLRNIDVDDIESLIKYLAEVQNKINILQNTSDYLFEKIRVDIE